MKTHGRLTGFSMRYAAFLFTLFSAASLFAGTYQDEAGNHIALKTTDGKNHPFDGHLAPNSSRQHVDLTNADFTRGWRQIRENSTKEAKQAEQALAWKHQLLRRQIRHIEEQTIRIKRDPGLAKLERQLEDIPGSLNAPEVKEELILQTKRQIKRHLDRLGYLDEKKKTLIRKIKQLKLSLIAVADLQGIDARGAKFKNAKFNYSVLAEANLARSDLAGASLVNTNLSDANLRNVELGAAQLKEANLSRANLRGAGVYAADFTGANLSGAVLRDIDGWEDAIWTDAYYQADDPAWWPEGMDPKQFDIREVKSAEESPVDEN